jgi:CelD/BcsL family acetyltransferase involved in cellulose biosynthesis
VWAAAKGWLRLAFLRLDGRPIAFEYLLEQNRTLFFLKGGYDERYRSVGPGILLLHDLMAASFERGLAGVELLGKDDPYKVRWADGVRPRSVLAAYAPTLGGSLRYALRGSLLVARNAVRGSGHRNA